MKSIYETLEFNKILINLSQFATSNAAKSICIDLKKIDNKNELYKALNETDAAVSYLNGGLAPSFDGIKDINGALARLRKEAQSNIIYFFITYYLFIS